MFNNKKVSVKIKSADLLKLKRERLLLSQMFPWSAVFSLEPKVPGQRTSEELVTNTLMLELGAMVKRTERIQLEKAVETRRRRNSSSADYSWLAGSQPHVPYELTPGDVLELQDLCAQIPPPQCGPVIVRCASVLFSIIQIILY